MKLFGVVGWKNSGKTGLMERLITHFSDQGLRVAALKHAHHAFDIDVPGTDSYRHRAAGASQVIVASGARLALIEELGSAAEPSLPELIDRLTPVDLVLAEGWKSAPHPKIEAYRATQDDPPLAVSNDTIVAVASDHHPTVPCPVLDIDETANIAALIAQELGL